MPASILGTLRGSLDELMVTKNHDNEGATRLLRLMLVVVCIIELRRSARDTDAIDGGSHVKIALLGRLHSKMKSAISHNDAGTEEANPDANEDGASEAKLEDNDADVTFQEEYTQLEREVRRELRDSSNAETNGTGVIDKLDKLRDSSNAETNGNSVIDKLDKLKSSSNHDVHSSNASEPSIRNLKKDIISALDRYAANQGTRPSSYSGDGKLGAIYELLDLVISTPEGEGTSWLIEPAPEQVVSTAEAPNKTKTRPGTPYPPTANSQRRLQPNTNTGKPRFGTYI